MEVSFRRLTALALLVFAAGQVIILVELTHDGDETGQLFVGGFLALALVLALVVDRFDRWWASATAFVAGVFATLTILPYADHVMYFDAAWEFAPVTLSLLGSLGAVVFAAIDLNQRRRHAATSAPAYSAPAYAIGVGALVTLIVVSFAVTYATVDTVSAREREGATAVEMSGIEFQPTELTASAGEPVKLVVNNNDLGPHTFVLEAPGASVDVRFNSGDEKIVAFAIDKLGTYTFACDIEGHGDMKGTVVVR